jgi:hypothetical protein
MCIICFIQLVFKVQDKFFNVINHVQLIEMGNLFKVRFTLTFKKKKLILKTSPPTFNMQPYKNIFYIHVLVTFFPTLPIKLRLQVVKDY